MLYVVTVPLLRLERRTFHLGRGRSVQLSYKGNSVVSISHSCRALECKSMKFYQRFRQS